MSTVLLKNEGSLLPLDASKKPKIAMIGVDAVVAQRHAHSSLN